MSYLNFPHRSLLGDVIAGRDNNLNLLRLVFSAFVLVSHAAQLASGRGTPECLSWLLHFTLGTLGVYGFFFISGLLVTRSLLQRNSLSEYFRARTLRIFPGLAVVLLLSVLVVGPAATSLPLGTYFSRVDTWTYFPRNISLYFLQGTLPGVFISNPFNEAINGSLWTLPYEFTLYIVLAAVWACIEAAKSGKLWTAAMVSALALILSVKVFVGFRGHGLENLADVIVFAYCFCAGLVAYLARNVIRLDASVALIVLLVSVLMNYFYPSRYIFLLGFFYAILVMAYYRSRLLSRYNAVGDFSYGIYIYAFPIQQICAWKFPSITPLTLCIVAFPLTLMFAVMSWYIIEKPALRLKRSSREGRLK